MKSPFALLATLVLLSACGQTGPLYMPKPPKAPAQTPIGNANANNPEATTNKPIPAPQQ